MSRHNTGYSSLSNIDGSSVSDNHNSVIGTAVGCGVGYRRWIGVRRSTWLLFLYAAMYASFLVSGAVLLADIESASDENIKAEVFRAKQEFLKSHPSVRASDLETLLSVALGAQDSGLSPLDAGRNATKWNLGDAVLFTVSLVTTVGYGQVSPLTYEGKLFCLLYILAGIPFSLVLLSASVARLLRPTRRTLDRVFSWLSEDVASPATVRFVHLGAMSVFFVVVFVLLPAAVFASLEEEWSYMDSVYFVVISLTTVGLGDLVPGRRAEANSESDAAVVAYRILVAVFLLLGQVFLTLTVTLFCDVPQLSLVQALQHHADVHPIQQQQQQPQQQQQLACPSRFETGNSEEERTPLLSAN